MSGLGRRQREVLSLMQRHGGVWPPHWRILSSQRRCTFDALERRGLIRRVTTHTRRGQVQTYRLVLDD